MSMMLLLFCGGLWIIVARCGSGIIKSKQWDIRMADLTLAPLICGLYRAEKVKRCQVADESVVRSCWRATGVFIESVLPF